MRIKARLGPYSPSREEVIREALKLADVQPDEVVLDLGCGDGRIPIMAVKEFGAIGIGVEADPKRIAECQDNAKGVDGVTFIYGDVFNADISKADVVTMYLSLSGNAALRPKLERQLKKGARVVALGFPIPDMSATKKVNTSSIGSPSNLYLYKKWR